MHKELLKPDNCDEKDEVPNPLLPTSHFHSSPPKHSSPNQNSVNSLTNPNTNAQNILNDLFINP